MREARLAKIWWLTELEKLKTGIMVGEWVPAHVFEEIASRIVSNCKNRIECIPNKTAAVIVNMDVADIRNLLREEFDESLAESSPFDVRQYQSLCKQFVLSLDQDPQANPEPGADSDE